MTQEQKVLFTKQSFLIAEPKEALFYLTSTIQRKSTFSLYSAMCFCFQKYLILTVLYLQPTFNNPAYLTLRYFKRQICFRRYARCKKSGNPNCYESNPGSRKSLVFNTFSVSYFSTRNINTTVSTWVACWWQSLLMQFVYF